MKKLVHKYYPFVYLFALVLFASCQKEYSYEGGPQASYIIEGSPAVCAPVVLSGYYIVGAPTGNTNTLQVTVQVTSVGNYTIFTIPTDGISFSASGNFATTGTQVVTLQCSGTPASVGTFTIKIPGTNGCYFTLNVLKQAPASYVLSGYPNDCSNPKIEGVFAAGSEVKATNSITIEVIVNTPGDYIIRTDTINGISFSASGHFNSAGPQTVVLKGVGMPGDPGLLFFNLNSDSSHCSFNLPVQCAEPLATYVLQSGTAPTGLVCAPQSIQGTYAAGVALNSSNTITITPYATLPGNYAISTARINGVVFSAIGNFPTAGQYSVALKGSGTPLSSGTFTYTPFIIGPSPIGGESCDVSITVQ